MTPVSRVPHAPLDNMWLMRHKAVGFGRIRFVKNHAKLLFNSGLAIYATRQRKLAVALL